MIVKQLKAEEALTLIKGFKAKPHYRQACDKPVFVTFCLRLSHFH